MPLIHIHKKGDPMVDLKKVSLSLAIGVVFAFFIGFLIDAVYEQPTYERYCKNGFDAYPAPKNDGVQVQCPRVYDQKLLQACHEQGGYTRYTYDEKGCEKEMVCELCGKQFNDDLKQYNTNLFYITFPLGLLATILGMYLPLSVEAIASGFMLGGIFTIIQITVRVFGDLGKFGRVILLGLELVLLLWVGYKKVSTLKPAEKKKK